MTLRPYQQDAHDAIIGWIKKNTTPCCIEAATGAGKSHIIAAVADTIHAYSKGKHVLCLAPSAELVKQNSEKFKATGEKCSIFSASAGEKSLRHPVVFGTPGTVMNSIKRFGNEFAAVVIDECFLGDTLVKTIYGEKKINSLRNGDIVCNAVGNGEIMGVFTKSVSEIYEVRLTDGKTIRCTGNHPFFTTDGWVEAAKLVNGQVVFRQEDVSRLRFGVWAKKVQAQREGECVPMLGSTLGKARNLLSVLLKEVEEPDALGSITSQDVKIFENHWAPSDGEDGKWNWEYKTSGSSFERDGGWVDSGVLHQNKCGAQEWRLPELLQGGYCEPIHDDCNRSGWGEPQYPRKESPRQEKGQFFGQIRVESVSRIKFSCPEIVYNLHVSGHPSYYAGGVLVHNCHGITPTVKSIIEEIRKVNLNLRVIGLSATPYRMGTGYIFCFYPDGKPVPASKTKDPYFEACVYRIHARTLIDQGFLTEPTIGRPTADGYKTLDMQLNSRGQFDAEAIDRAYHGQGRKTSAIMADVVAQSQFRRGVMIFAATVKHAKECMESLPPDLSALVTGETPKKERDALIRSFKSGKVKYLVNVSVLTTGFDAAHVELIAILRATESVGLLQQIIGRGLRIDEFKETCVILDYAENLPRHCPDGDVFNPKIEVTKGDKEDSSINCICPLCSVENEFSPRPNPQEHMIDQNGYFVDLDGQQIVTEWGGMPAHYGRRCGARVTIAGERIQCTYRWTFKPCPHCKEENDIAARYCTKCKGEIVNPNDKLKIEFKAMKRDPTKKQTDKVVTWDKRSHISRSGKETWKIDVVTEYRSFAYYIMKEPNNAFGMRDLTALNELNGSKPLTITYQLNPDTSYFRVFAYNRPADAPPE
jgi:DNA repair protein RadD